MLCYVWLAAGSRKRCWYSGGDSWTVSRFAREGKSFKDYGKASNLDQLKFVGYWSSWEDDTRTLGSTWVVNSLWLLSKPTVCSRIRFILNQAPWACSVQAHMTPLSEYMMVTASLRPPDTLMIPFSNISRVSPRSNSPCQWTWYEKHFKRHNEVSFLLLLSSGLWNPNL